MAISQQLTNSSSAAHHDVSIITDIKERRAVDSF